MTDQCVAFSRTEQVFSNNSADVYSGVPKSKPGHLHHQYTTQQIFTFSVKYEALVVPYHNNKFTASTKVRKKKLRHAQFVIL
jgi:hypothetical protein